MKKKTLFLGLIVVISMLTVSIAYAGITKFTSENSKKSPLSASDKVLFCDNNNFVQVDDKIYYIYQTGTGLLNNTYYNVFTLGTVEDGEFKELSYAYAREGAQDILVNSNKTVFVAGGASSSTLNMTGSEKAVLNIWIYEDGFLNGLTTQIDFSRAGTERYQYLSSSIRNDIITSLFYAPDAENVGKYAVEAFMFDTVSMQWLNETKVSIVSENPRKAEPTELTCSTILNSDTITAKIGTNNKAKIYVNDVLVNEVSLSANVTPSTQAYLFVTGENKLSLFYAGYSSGKLGWYKTEIAVNESAN